MLATTGGWTGPALEAFEDFGISSPPKSSESDSKRAVLGAETGFRVGGRRAAVGIFARVCSDSIDNAKITIN